MRLRFSCVAGWGWVAGMGGCIAERAHPLEKSATISRSASIHCFSRRQVEWSRFIADSSPSAVMGARQRKSDEHWVSVAVAVTFRRRSCRRVRLWQRAQQGNRVEEAVG